MAVEMQTTRKALIVNNPAAGRRQAHHLVGQVAMGLRRAGWLVELENTQYQGHATELAAQAKATAYDIVVAAGGDGTINEVLQPLVGSDTALAVVPVGTVNVWAAETHSPTDAAGLVALFNAHAVRHVDVGLAGTRYFLLMAGLGLDAAVVRDVVTSLKRRIGRWAYIATLSSLARDYRGTPTVLRLDGEQIDRTVLMVVIGNTRRYAGSLRATPEAVVDDGMLDVFAICGEHLLHGLPQARALLHSAPRLRKRTLYRRVRTIQIEAHTALPIQVDGDFSGMTPVTIQAIPRSLRVIVRPGRAGGLFGSANESTMGAPVRG